MARPERHDVDYFPFYAKRGKTLNILQSKYGLEGIGFFTNLMRFLSLTPDHYYCIKDETDRLNFFAEIGMTDENRGIAIIELMVKTEKLDKTLWEKYKVIVCQALLESIKDAYKNRNNEIITIEQIMARFENNEGGGVSNSSNPENEVRNPVICEFPFENSSNNPQTKLKETKLKKRKLDSCGLEEPPDEKLSSSQKSDKPKKLPLREREPDNDCERVEKAYLQNWDLLYSQKKVIAREPAMSYGKQRKLLNSRFAVFKLEQIIEVIKKGMSDRLVLENGYSLPYMLMDTTFNRLINSGSGPPPGANSKKTLSGLNTTF